MVGLLEALASILMECSYKSLGLFEYSKNVDFKLKSPTNWYNDESVTANTNYLLSILAILMSSMGL
jgi:hypothetical protein